MGAACDHAATGKIMQKVTQTALHCIGFIRHLHRPLRASGPAAGRAPYLFLAIRGFGGGTGSAALALAFSSAAAELVARLATAAGDISLGIFGMGSPGQVRPYAPRRPPINPGQTPNPSAFQALQPHDSHHGAAAFHVHVYDFGGVGVVEGQPLQRVRLGVFQPFWTSHNHHSFAIGEILNTQRHVRAPKGIVRRELKTGRDCPQGPGGDKPCQGPRQAQVQFDLAL